MEVQEIPLGQLVPSPNNPRIIRDNDPTLKELSESIQALGVMSPIVVREINLADAQFVFEIVAGERRFRASKIAGKETVPALVRVLTDHEALELTVTENLQREDLHPLEEANGVAKLVEAGHSFQEIADRLGKTLSWVARRARIDGLTEKWRKAIADPKSPISTWSASMLEVVARIDKAAQDAALQEIGGTGRGRYHVDHLVDVADVRRALADFTRELRLAPWKLADDTLHPKAGSCLACFKRSSCNPGLFDDEVDERTRQTVASTSDRCLDATCWGEKSARQLEERAATLQAEHGNVRFANDFDQGDKLPAFAKDRMVRTWEGRHSTKADKGATPVLHIGGSKCGQVEWINFSKSRSPAARKAGGAKKETSLAERKATLNGRRLAHALQATCEAVVASAPPKASDLLLLALAFGTDRDTSQFHTDGDPLKALKTKKAEAELWKTVAPVLSRRWLMFHRWQGLKGIAKTQPEIEAVAEILGLDLSPFARLAEEAIPEPKSWAKLADAEATKKRAAKKTPTRKTPATKAAKKGAAK